MVKTGIRHGDGDIGDPITATRVGVEVKKDYFGTFE